MFPPLYRVRDFERTPGGRDAAKLADLARGTLDAALFADREIYRTEVQQIFGSSWLFLGHENQLQNPGDWVRTRMGTQSIIVLRNTEGELRAFINTCRHAGYRLCPGDRGSLTRIQCELHGWTYDLDGKFVAMAGYGGAFQSILNRDDWGLISLAGLARYEGLLFGTFDTPAEPFEDFLAKARPMLDLLASRVAHVDLTSVVYKWNVHANWKFAADHLGPDDLLLLPNASFSRDSQILHVWHPINPTSTEVWAYVLAKDATEQEKLDLIARDEQLGYATKLAYGAVAKAKTIVSAQQRVFYKAWTARIVASAP
ncbi:MAG TPA: aromatic ring-hydroxylating dioxygenase subunit alpha [Chloroflexota bacterium]